MISVILYVATTAFMGWNVVSLITARVKSKPSFLEAVGLSYLLGTGIVTLQMFVMGLFGMTFTRGSILLPWIIVVIANSLVLRSNPDLNPNGDGSPQITKPTCREIRPHRAVRVRGNGWRGSYLTLLCFIAFQFLYNLFRALMRPIEAYDAAAIYGIKSKMMYLAGGIPPNFFQSIASNFHGAHPDYPLLLPLAESWFYVFIGGFNDILVKAIFPLAFLAFLFVFYAGLTRITRRPNVSILFTFFLASVKQFSDYSTIGVADMWLGIYFAVSLIYLYRWFESRDDLGLLGISLISSILCLWTKNEGMLLVLITLSVILFYILNNLSRLKRREALFFAFYASLVIFGVLFWGAFRSSHGLVNENFNLSMLTAKNFIPGLRKVPAIIYEYQKHLFGFKKWNIIWIVFILLLLLRRAKAFSNTVKYLTLTFFLFGLGYLVMYMFSAVEIRFFLGCTGSRFLLHVLPLAVFWMGIMVHEEG